MSTASPHADTPDYSAWVNRSKTITDTASATARTGLAGILPHGLSHAANNPQRLFPLGHWLQFVPTEPLAELGEDGHPRLGDFMPPLQLPRRMWAGSRIEFVDGIEVGDELERTTTIESITPKRGSTGELCFVVLRHDITAGGRAALVERQTIVYREAAVSDSEPAARPPRRVEGETEGWDWVQSVTPNEIMLFRYSALTYNSHRIHYDPPYATGVENYPGLVTHGPLSASLLIDAFLHETPDADVVSYEFSARSPVFVGEKLRLCGKAIESGAGHRAQELAVIAPDSQVAITAKVEFR